MDRVSFSGAHSSGGKDYPRMGLGCGACAFICFVSDYRCVEEFFDNVVLEVLARGGVVGMVGIVEFGAYVGVWSLEG